MSEKSQPKNTLLSASVIGLTADDFAHNALLMPAAALPVPPAPVVAEQPAIIASDTYHSRQDPVFFGNVTPFSTTTDQFSEINLNAPNIAAEIPPNAPSVLSPLEDTNQNYSTNFFGYTQQGTPFGSQTLNEETNQNHANQESLITSLSKLPSAATSVLSSFSSILRGTPEKSEDPNSNATSAYQPTSVLSSFSNYLKGGQPNQQPHQNQDTNPIQGNQWPQDQPAYQQPTPQYFDHLQTEPPAVPLPPPKLYAPAEVPASAANSNQDLTAGNAFRLNRKKKQYAPIPGFGLGNPPPPVQGIFAPSDDLNSYAPPLSTAPIPQESAQPAYQESAPNFPPPPPHQVVQQPFQIFSPPNAVPEPLKESTPIVESRPPFGITQPSVVGFETASIQPSIPNVSNIQPIVANPFQTQAVGESPLFFVAPPSGTTSFPPLSQQVPFFPAPIIESNDSIDTTGQNIIGDSFGNKIPQHLNHQIIAPPTQVVPCEIPLFPVQSISPVQPPPLILGPRKTVQLFTAPDQTQEIRNPFGGIPLKHLPPQIPSQVLPPKITNTSSPPVAQPQLFSAAAESTGLTKPLQQHLSPQQSYFNQSNSSTQVQPSLSPSSSDHAQKLFSPPNFFDQSQNIIASNANSFFTPSVPVSSGKSELDVVAPTVFEPAQVPTFETSNNPTKCDSFAPIIESQLDKFFTEGPLKEAPEFNSDNNQLGFDYTDMTSSKKKTSNASQADLVYRPVYKHWFYAKTSDENGVWEPFSMNDSMALEDAFDSNSTELIQTDGGRCDVNVQERTRTPVYWSGTPTEVRRCSWFHKAVVSRFVPYTEDVADQLEQEYKEAVENKSWHRKIALPNGEAVDFHGPNVMVHFIQTESVDELDDDNNTISGNRPRVVKRGCDEFDIDDGEPEQVDHLLFMVHGIGAACDLKFRTVEEVVDEFRSIALQLVQSHYSVSLDRGQVGRIEVLPISWHNELHSEETGIDEKLKMITLESIPKLRNFTNETLLDILFYTSPVFCQSIMSTVGNSLNKLHTMFCRRNPSFKGGISLAGHSLGSLIVFDLLCHQKKADNEVMNSENPDLDDPLAPLSSTTAHPALQKSISQHVNYTIGAAGTGQPFINYPQLHFQPSKFFALGSPIGMFVTIRGIDTLGLDFQLPTCGGFYNIFHPFDPVAYRVESLINTDLSTMRPVLIPHHKGRKRMHLELRETIGKLSAEIKQKFLSTIRSTLETVTSFKPNALTTKEDLEHEVNKVLEENLKLDGGNVSPAGSAYSHCPHDEQIESTDKQLHGCLNAGRRIDFVLQEAPLEYFNEYLFALTSHVCYWESEDTTLFIVKEIYASLGVQSDGQVPQQTMTIERPTSTNNKNR